MYTKLILLLFTIFFANTISANSCFLKNETDSMPENQFFPKTFGNYSIQDQTRQVKWRQYINDYQNEEKRTLRIIPINKPENAVSKKHAEELIENDSLSLGLGALDYDITKTILGYRVTPHNNKGGFMSMEVELTDHLMLTIVGYGYVSQLEFEKTVQLYLQNIQI